MTVAYADFITAFPEFTNTTTYPQATVIFWLDQAYATLDACRFGTQLNMVAMLFTAHNVVLAARNAASAATAGGITGMATGLQTSKAVGPVSASYDVTATTSANAGIYNATSYGQRFWMMVKAKAAGPRYRPGFPRGGTIPFLGRLF